MKKGKFLVVALVGLLLVAGLVLISCGNKCNMDGNCDIAKGTPGTCGSMDCAAYKELFDKGHSADLTKKCNC